MRYFQSFLILSALLVLFPGAASAQQNKSWQPHPLLPTLQGQGFLAGPQYSRMTYEALTDRPADFNFTVFRAQYTETKHYDPLGETAKKWLLQSAYNAQYEQDKEKRAQALRDYDALVMDHLANIDVVTQALSLSRQDPRFGDAAAFEWMRQGLIKSIIQSGDGGNIYRAYDVVTMGEESALLNALNVEVIKSDLRESGGFYYVMHEVKEPGQDGSRTIFVNVSLPMTRLEQERRMMGVGFSIPAQ